MFNFEIWFLLFLFCIIVYHYKKTNDTEQLIIYKKRKHKEYDDRFNSIYHGKRNIDTSLTRLNYILRKQGNIYSTSKGIYHTVKNSNQRTFGYCKLYDEAAALFGIIIDCEPITFQYKKKQWLIEFWKGQYGAALGAEVGIFCSKNNNLEVPQLFSGIFYEAVEPKDYLQIEMICRRNGVLIFVCFGIQYLINGFILGEFTKPSDLSLDITLTFPCNGMRNAFLRGLKKAGYHSNEYSVRQKKVCVYFHKPHTIQPLSKVLLEKYKLVSCNTICKLFSEITSEEKDPILKFMLLKKQDPILFNKLSQFGKTNAMYHSVYQYLKPYL